MDHIGRYRLVRRVGSGAFATVWLAHDDVLDVPVAVKVLADNWTHRQDIRERFLHEARLLRRLDEDRLVRVYDIGELDDGRPYFVMDYADGGSLDDVLKQGVVALDRVVAYAIGAAEALTALHRHGVVHRDLTPGNLLLRTGRDGTTRLIIADLGMAKALAEASGLTQVAGTPAYMAPEQAGGQGGFDVRADVYALGAVTYTLLTGQPPFDFKSVSEVMVRRPDLKPVPPSRLRPDGVPAPVEAVVLRALAHDQNARWQSAAAFAEALRAAYEGSVSGAPGTGAVQGTGGIPGAGGFPGTGGMPGQAPVPAHGVSPGHGTSPGQAASGQGTASGPAGTPYAGQHPTGPVDPGLVPGPRPASEASPPVTRAGLPSSGAGTPPSNTDRALGTGPGAGAPGAGASSGAAAPGTPGGAYARAPGTAVQDPVRDYWDPESLVEPGGGHGPRPAVLLGWAVLVAGSLLLFAAAFYSGLWLFS